MFNNYARIDSKFNETMIDYNNAMHSTIELIIEQLFATNFDDIYTMHIYASNENTNEFIVDVAFELHTNEFERDENNDIFEHKHNYDMRVHLNLRNDSFDFDDICNTIENVEFEIVYRNAYKTIEYN